MKQLVALVGLVFGFLVAAPGAYAQSCGGAVPGGGFAYTPAVSDQVYAEHPLVAMVLSNVSNRGTRLVGSQHVRGGSTLGNAGGYRYHADITADPTGAVIELAFQRVGDGPLPDAQRVEIGQDGAVLTSLLSPDQAEAVLKRVPPACDKARPRPSD